MAAPGTAAPATPESDGLAALLQRELGGEITVREEVRRDALMAVFAGVETRQSRAVHVHVVLPDVAAVDPARAQRVLRAARATAKLRHPRVAPVYRVSAGDRLCWFVTPPEAGETLGVIVGRAGALPLERVTDIVQHVAAALTCAHEQRIMHGALSPASVLLGKDGTASVRDFGLPPADTTTLREYRAPELDTPTISGATSLSALTGMSAEADQYALGILAWQMLTGSTPFADIAPAAWSGAEDRRLPPLTAVRPDLPAGVGTVIERATAPRPSDRYPSVAKFAQSLRAAAEGRPSAPARPALRPRASSGLLLGPEPQAIAPTAPAPAGPPIAHLPDETPRRRTIRRPVILSALGGATALALVLMLAWRSNDDEMSPAERQRLEAAARYYGTQPAAAEEPLVAPPDAAPAAEPPAAPAPAASEPRRKPVETPHQAAQRRQREAQQRAAQQRRTATPPPISANTAWVTIGTNPQAAIFINETPVPTNPVINWPVKSGQVFLRFEVLDNSSGVWSRDMVVNVAPGDTLNLRRIRLTRP